MTPHPCVYGHSQLDSVKKESSLYWEGHVLGYVEQGGNEQHALYIHR